MSPLTVVILAHISIRHNFQHENTKKPETVKGALTVWIKLFGEALPYPHHIHTLTKNCKKPNFTKLPTSTSKHFCLQFLAAIGWLEHFDSALREVTGNAVWQETSVVHTLVIELRI